MDVRHFIRLITVAGALCRSGTALAEGDLTLGSTALASGGGRLGSASFGLGFSAGQSITGMAANVGEPRRFAETAGFWRWGALPVLGVGGDDPSPSLVAEFQLSPGFPNPSRARTSIRYAIPGTSEARVDLRLYDVSGRLIRVLVSGTSKPGVHTITWDGRDVHGLPVGAGLYFCHMEAGSFRATQRLAVVR